MDEQSQVAGESTHRDDLALRRHLSKGYLILFSALSLIAGMVLLIMVRVPRAIASLGWPVTEGAVISSEVAESGAASNETWYPHVVYRYSLDGREHLSEDIEVISVSNGNTDLYARHVVERYPAGELVQVYYDPGDPAMAVLEPGFPDNGLFAPILFFAGAGGGLLLVFIGLLFAWSLITGRLLRLPVGRAGIEEFAL